MSNTKNIIICCVLLSCAQLTFAQDNEHGEVTIHSDPRLSVLLKKSKLIASIATGTRLNEATVVKTAPMITPPAPAVVHQPAPAPVATVQHHEVRTIYTGKGYRVQIYNGPDRAKALSVKSEFMRHFPGVHSYLIYSSPGFRVKIGDYRNRSDAEGMLREANSMFNPSMIVPDLVTISTY